MCCEKWDNSTKTLPGLRLDGVLECAFADSCKKITLKKKLNFPQMNKICSCSYLLIETTVYSFNDFICFYKRYLSDMHEVVGLISILPE